MKRSIKERTCLKNSGRKDDIVVKELASWGIPGSDSLSDLGKSNTLRLSLLSVNWGEEHFFSPSF